MRILLVEDEPDAARVLAKALREQSYAVDIAVDGPRALAAIADVEYAAIVLDVRLPRRDGLSVCRQLRADGAITPVLMVTALDSVDARIAGLDAGADDYVIKPFDLGELLARLRAIIRRGGARQPRPAHLTVGPLTIDTRARQVTRHGQPVSLTAREYAVLELFTRRPGALITRARSPRVSGATHMSRAPIRSTSTSSFCGASSTTSTTLSSARGAVRARVFT